MEGMLERLLPLIASYGIWWLAALLALCLLAVARLGRGRRWLVPARWPGRIAALALVGGSMFAIAGLYLLLGPMRPMLDQVRAIQGAVGRPAGDLVFRQVADDAPGRLAELRGKVVLVNLWATWCPPCRHELPAIDRLQRDYRDRGLVVVTLSNEERDRLRAFAATHPLTTLNVYAERLGWLEVGGRPLSMVIDRAGVVRACAIGRRGYREFESMVKALL